MLARWFLPAFYFGLPVCHFRSNVSSRGVCPSSPNVCPPTHVRARVDGGVSMENSVSTGAHFYSSLICTALYFTDIKMLFSGDIVDLMIYMCDQMLFPCFNPIFMIHMWFLIFRTHLVNFVSNFVIIFSLIYLKDGTAHGYDHIVTILTPSWTVSGCRTYSVTDVLTPS